MSENSSLVDICIALYPTLNKFLLTYLALYEAFVIYPMSNVGQCWARQINDRTRTKQHVAES